MFQLDAITVEDIRGNLEGLLEDLQARKATLGPDEPDTFLEGQIYAMAEAISKIYSLTLLRGVIDKDSTRTTYDPLDTIVINIRQDGVLVPATITDRGTDLRSGIVDIVVEALPHP